MKVLQLLLLLIIVARIRAHDTSHVSLRRIKRAEFDPKLVTHNTTKILEDFVHLSTNTEESIPEEIPLLPEVKKSIEKTVNASPQTAQATAKTAASTKVEVELNKLAKPGGQTFVNVSNNSDKYSAQQQHVGKKTRRLHSDMRREKNNHRNGHSIVYNTKKMADIAKHAMAYKKSIDKGNKNEAKHMRSELELFEDRADVPKTKPKTVVVFTDANADKYLHNNVPGIVKFANMLMYKMDMDGKPYQTQSSKIGMSASPIATASVSCSAVPEADIIEPMEYFYNNMEQTPFMHSAMSQPAGISSRAMNFMPSIFFQPPHQQQQQHARSEEQLPINFLENALDMLLANEEDNNEEVELRCPIHQQKDGTASLSDSDGEHNDMAGDNNKMIQLCTCRLIKKKCN